MRFKSLVLFLFIASMLVSGLAAAKFPENPITYTIPFSPGGESDITARLQEPVLEKLLGVNVNVVDHAGGGGAVAWSQFQNNAKANGYHVIGVNLPHIIAQPILRNNAGFKTNDWNIIMFFQYTPNALIVPKDSPFKSLKDFVSYAKKHPQELTLGGSGSGSANNLAVLRLEKEAGIKLTYIPYEGTGPLSAAIQGHHVSALMSYSTLGVQLQDNARVLAVTSKKRVSALPNAPTFIESGYNQVGGAYRGVAVPKGTPEKKIRILQNAFSKANKKITKKQRPLGYVMTYITGDEIGKTIKEVRAAYSPVLNEVKNK